MKKLFLLLLLLATSARAQLSPASSSTGSITTNASNCFTTNVCVVLHMATSNVGYSVAVSGTWTGTLTVEQSADNQTSWASATTTTANTLYSSALTPGITDVRVRGSAAMTGAAVVTITASGPATLQQITQTGGGGVSPNSPVPAASAQGPRYNVKNYGAIGDAKKTVTAVVTNTSSTITDASSAPWLSTDVGKKIFCVGQGGGGQGNSEITPTIATITAFTSSSSISISPSVGNGNASNPGVCVWFTQKETASILAAGTAAKQALTGIRPFLGPALAYPGAVYCPEGGYVVDGAWFIQNSAAGNSLGVSFIGAGKSACTLYVSPDVTVTSGVWALLSVQNTGMTFSDFTIDCSLENLAVAGSLMYFNTDANYNIRNMEVDGCGTTGDSAGLLRFTNNTNLIADHLTINNAPVVIATTEPPIQMSGGSFINFRNLYTTNPGPSPIVITASGGQAFAGGPRSLVQGGILIENSVIDEGGNPVVLQIANGSTVNIVGSSFFEGITGGVSVDGTSSLYITNSHIAPFGGTCSGGNRNALQLAANSAVYSTGSTYESCGSNGAGLSAAINGPSTATFVSMGGNDIRNCPSGPPCSLVTAANYATLGFAGGIVPKSSETHTPNTCHLTITPIVNATTYTLCNNFMDQNYQILKITASSQNVTTCATAPIVTIGDGTQSATLTLTSGAATWASAAQSAVFASGNTMTVKYDVAAASACATPPTNLAISFVLQSVLNP